MESFLDGKVTLYRGDCLEVLPTLEADSIDSCVTDPPYHLTSIVKRFGKENSAPLKGDRENGPYRRVSTGFMGKQWDGGDIAFRPEIWAEVLRVLKPGAHLLAFSGTRTYHRMACAIEDVGFEIRDQIGWCYGSGFPKSHDVSKGIDRLGGAERAVVGQRISEGGRCGSQNSVGAHLTVAGKIIDITVPATESAIQWQGWGTALKPAWEPICLARKPLSEPSIAANVLKHGTGGINVDGCRVAALVGDYDHPGNQGIEDKRNVYGAFANGNQSKPNKQGRWPANLIHDGSEEVLAGFPENISQAGGNRGASQIWGGAHGEQERNGFDDSGSAARFFYTAKADSDDRLGSKHPTVKPLDLMQYLVRLVTPKGGVVLDPFAGTGTLGEAAFYEGMRAVLIEREAEYQAEIVKRMGLCLTGPDARRAASVEQLHYADLPMFRGLK